MDKIEIAVRLVIIKNEKILLISNDRDGFYYFPGGKLQFRELIEETCKREVKEEMGNDVEFIFGKLLYVDNFISASNPNKHKLELFILGEINKFEELEGKNDPEHKGDDHLTWVSIAHLPENVYPRKIIEVLLEDFKTNFENHNVQLLNTD